MAKHTHHQTPGNRPLRVGEEIRHILSNLLRRGESGAPELDSASITVSEVRVSPDLKNATVFVMPLGGLKQDEILNALIRQAPYLRALVGNNMSLRYVPRLNFTLDKSFENASRIDELLKSVPPSEGEN